MRTGCCRLERRRSVRPIFGAPGPVWVRLVSALAVLALVPLASCSAPKPQPPSQHEVQEFHNAVADGDAIIVDRLLRAKPGLLHARDAEGRTALESARQRGHDELVDLLQRRASSK